MDASGVRSVGVVTMGAGIDLLHVPTHPARAGVRRLGRKTVGGFYEYPEGSED